MLYAGTYGGGVFKSTDSGATWAAANTGLTNWVVQALAVDPTAATLYAGTGGDGVFKSTDSGAHLGRCPRGRPERRAPRLCQSPGPGRHGGDDPLRGCRQRLAIHTSRRRNALLPSSARAPGAGGAFYTTDVTVANTGASDTGLTLKFLGNNQDGSGGAERSFTLAAGQSTTYADILGSVFGETTNFGAISISSSSPSFVVLGQTSTPGFGGTFGQSVPAARPSDLITGGAPRSIVGVREDGAFRTNLILSNATSASLDVDVALFADTGANLGNKRYTLEPLGMTQVTRVVRDMGLAADVRGARVVLSTPTAGGSFSAYASAIDNVTNDPRTLLPKGPPASPQSTNVWFLPSSARASGAGGAFYTTDLTVSNTSGIDSTFDRQVPRTRSGRHGRQRADLRGGGRKDGDLCRRSRLGLQRLVGLRRDPHRFAVRGAEHPGADLDPGLRRHVRAERPGLGAGGPDRQRLAALSRGRPRGCRLPDERHPVQYDSGVARRGRGAHRLGRSDAGLETLHAALPRG